MEQQNFDFEKKIKRIQEIVEILDSGDETLEILIAKYEEGMKLTKECNDFLEKAENKIIDITNSYLPAELLATTKEE